MDTVRALRQVPSQWWLLALLWVAAGLGMRGLTADPFWYDEWYSLYYAGAAPLHGPIDLATFLQRVQPNNEFNPPGFYFLLHLWGGVVGWTPLATRLLPLLAGLLTVALIYRLGRDLGGSVMGMSAAVALAGSAFFIYQWHELRAYALLALLVALVLWTYGRGLRARRPGGWLAALGLAMALLFYTHYTAIPLLGALGLYHLFFVRKNGRWLAVSTVALLALVPFLPWLGLTLAASQAVSVNPGTIAFALDAPGLIARLLTIFTGGAVPLLLIFGWYSLGFRQHPLRTSGSPDGGRRFIWVLLLGTLGLLLILNERFRFLTVARYLLALWPLLALLVGLGAAQMSRQRLRPALILLLLAGGGLPLMWAAQAPAEADDPGWRVYLPWEVARVAYAPARSGDRFLHLLPDGTPYWFHAPVAAYYLSEQGIQMDRMPDWIAPEAFPESRPDAPRLRLIESLPERSPADYTAAALDFIPTDVPRRVWLAWHPALPPGVFTRPAVEAALSERGYRFCTVVREQADLRLDLYLPSALPDAALVFGDGQLRLATVGEMSARAGLLPVALVTSRVADERPLSIALHLDDAAGNLVAQSDFPAPGGEGDCAYVTLATTRLRPGTYRLYALVYDSVSGERLTGLNPTDGFAGDRVLLGTVMIEPAP